MVGQDGQARSLVNYGSTSTFPAAIFVTGQSPGHASITCWSLISDPIYAIFCVPSGQAAPASSPDGTQTAAESSMNMSSPLENL